MTDSIATFSLLTAPDSELKANAAHGDRSLAEWHHMTQSL